jgi:GNAT superfamily N-acetyltransferase
LTEADKPLLGEVELLRSEHEISSFDCERHPSLNLWLKRFALMNQASGDTRTYVVVGEKKVVGYYSLAPGSISRKEATTRAAKAAPDPIPVVLLARLAVDKAEQGQGLGKALLKDALSRAYAGAEIIGGRAILVHAIDQQAADFYARFGFEACPGMELHRMLLMKDVRKSLGI